MILQSLVNYYEILAAAGEISEPGYSIAKVSYALDISVNGELISIIPMKQQVTRGKKTFETPQSIKVPEQVKKTSGVNANFLCDNSSYVLSISTKKDDTDLEESDREKEFERTRQCFRAFKELHHRILDGIDSIEAKAILLFLDDWQPEKAETCQVLKDYLHELTSGAGIVFHINGYGYAHEIAAIKQTWEDYKRGHSNEVKMQCLVTGDVKPIARLHSSIKNLKGAQSSGASIVSFNATAYESYGHTDQQGLNAPVSEYAAFAYTTVLNYLLSDVEHKQTYGDTTVVYWAKTTNKIYQNIFKFALDPIVDKDKVTVDKESEGDLNAIFEKVVGGKAIGDLDDMIDGNTQFYILGLAPNASRISIRFFMENTFGNIMNHVVQHFRDLEIEKSPNDFEYLPLWKIMLETVSPKSKDKSASPLLAGAVLRAILTGTPYPKILFNSVIVRIRAEHEINRGKAAIIKACLIRSSKEKYKEELIMSLNDQSNNTAYVLGRLFAVLEKAQQDANPGINATIKDRYFTSACATPASTFPILLRLSNHHIAKANYGYVSERRISDLMDKLDVEKNPFPAHLNLDEQGLFILGYYHQEKANYVKREKEEK